MKEVCESHMEDISSKLEAFENNLNTKASITTVAKTVEELAMKVEEVREKPAQPLKKTITRPRLLKVQLRSEQKEVLI